MLNVAKCTIPFQQKLYGWTESYYLNNPSANLEAEMTRLISLAQKRILLSGQQTYLSYLKVSNESKLRDVRVSFLGPEGTTGYVGYAGEDSDAQSTALLVRRVNADNTKVAPLYLRGIWDSVVAQGGGVFGPPTFTALFNAYRAELLNYGWGFIAKSDASPARVAVSTVISNANGQVIINTSAPTFTVDQIGAKTRIFLSGIQGAAIVNGSQIVTPASANSCTTVKRIPIFPYEGGGFLTNSVLAFFPISTVEGTRIVERKAGRPLYLSRGRARARVLS